MGQGDEETMNENAWLEQIKAELIPVTQEEIRQEAQKLWELIQDTTISQDEYWLIAEKKLMKVRSEQIARKILGKIVNASQDCISFISDSGEQFRETTWKEVSDQFRVIRILPDGVRFHQLKMQSGDVENHMVIFEEKPAVRTIQVNMRFHRAVIGDERHGTNRENNVKRWRIALPYCVHAFQIFGNRILDHRMFFRNKPLASLKDPLGVSWLPNFYADGRSCNPFSDKDGETSEKITRAISDYWQTVFTYCMHHDHPHDERIETWEDWQEASKIDPLFVLKLEWNKLGYTLQTIVENFSANPTKNTQNALNQFIQKAVKCLQIEKTKAVIKVPPTVKPHMTEEEIADLVRHNLTQCLEDLRRKA